MKFGRQGRKFDDKVPKLSLIAKRGLAPRDIPTQVDYGKKLPSWTGMFGNDVLGDCTCAAVYHALQVWSANANPPMDIDAEVRAIQLYEEACGYVPSDPNSDQGGIEQDVLAYWLNLGVPRGVDSLSRQNLTAFVEVDQRSLQNIKAAIYEGGLVYIGFEVPAYFNFAHVWDIDPEGDATIIDGHAVILTGYNDHTGRFKLQSWGREYEMSYNFFLKFCDEAYFLVNAEWINPAGTTPLGMDLEELEEAMRGLRWDWFSTQWFRRHRHVKKRRKIVAATRTEPSV
jgi:hypothetical protein